MDFVYVGKIVNTHGIRGEIRLLSKFSHKDKAFRKGMNIYIGKDKVKEVVNSYRVHKCFDMITLSGYTNINDVLKYKGALCYVDRNDLELSACDYLDNDLIGLSVYVDDVVCGNVVKIEYVTDKNKVLVIDFNGEEKFVPFVDEFVEVEIESKKVIIKPIKGMF